MYSSDLCITTLAQTQPHHLTVSMDGLDEFEKQLAADKADRERSSHREHKHHHRRREHHRDGDEDEERRRHRHRHRDDREGHDDHRHKRRRRSRSPDDDRERRSKHRSHDKDDSKPSRHADKETAPDAPVRDAWMTAPSALEVEHVHRAAPKERHRLPPSQSANYTPAKSTATSIPQRRPHQRKRHPLSAPYPTQSATLARHGA